LFNTEKFGTNVRTQNKINIIVTVIKQSPYNDFSIFLLNAESFTVEYELRITLKILDIFKAWIGKLLLSILFSELSILTLVEIIFLLSLEEKIDHTNSRKYVTKK
jgi:hypothetical protein